MKQKQLFEEDNYIKNPKSTKMQQYLNELLTEKKKLKKKNIALRELRDKIQNDIKQATERCKELTIKKKTLINTLENLRLEKKLPVSKLVQKQRTIKLQNEIASLQKMVQEMTFRLETSKQQYNINLKRYDQVVIKIGQLSKQLEQTQNQVLTQVNNLKAIKNVNFDYEKLRRLLEDQKDFAIKAQINQNKSYEQKLKQLQVIKKKLLTQEESLNTKGKNTRKKSSILLLYNFLKSKISIYYRKFFTFQIYIIQGQKSIKCMKNFVQIIKQKGTFNLRVFFSKWHKNALEPMKLIMINEKLMQKNLILKTKIKTISKWNQEFNKNQLQVLNQYQKAKILISLRIQLSRKQVYIGFNRWRSNVRNIKGKSKICKRMINIFDRFQKRFYFRYWKNLKDNFNRILQANTILQQFNRIKALSRGLRKWRLNIVQYENSKVKQHLKRNNLRDLITKRLKYEKRKTKLITILQIKYVRNQLRQALYRYWGNVFAQKIQQKKVLIESQINLKEKIKSECKARQQNFHLFKKEIMLKILSRFMYKKKKLALLDWVNKNTFLRKRSQLLYRLLKKKNTVQKLHSLNRFRKNQKDFEKKQMHAVLTDLNHKMQSINTKSTQYREKLQQSIQTLSKFGQNKLEIAIDKIIYKFKKHIFQKFKRQKISRIYKINILKNLVKLCNKEYIKQDFLKIKIKAKNKKRSEQLKKLQIGFHKEKIRRIKRRLFYEWKSKTLRIKKAFTILSNYETLFFFYKFLVGFNKIKRKVRYLKIKNLLIQYKNIEKNLEIREGILQKNKKQNANLDSDIKNLLRRFFNFENLNQSNKQNTRLTNKTYKKYYYWRKLVRDDKIKTKRLQIFQRVLYKKNVKNFLKNLLVINFKKAILEIKQQMSKLAKKQKSFDEKTAKTRVDLQNRLKAEEQTHEQILNKFKRRQTKYNKYLEYIQRRNKNREKNNYVGGIFRVWKNEYLGTKNLFIYLQRIMFKKKIANSFHEIGNYIILLAKIAKRNFILETKMDLKQILLKKLALKLWNQKKRQIILNKVKKQIQLTQQQIEINKINYLSYAPLYAKAKFFYKKNIIFEKIFERFKKHAEKKIRRRKKVDIMNKKIGLRIKKQIYQIFNWRRYIKITTRNYIQNKNTVYNRLLIKDVFESLKVRRHNLKWAIRKFSSCNVKFRSKVLLYAYLKVRNVGLFQKDLLNHNRKKALHHLLQKLLTDYQLKKQRTLYRWHFHAIKRQHYLPYILNSLAKNLSLRIFYKIRQAGYWHKDLVAKIADKYMLQNKTDTKSNMSLLLQQNIDPQQIKQYMRTRTIKDTGIIRRVVHKMKSFGEKEFMVRGWKSWRQYIDLKKRIKRSLFKVVTISEGKGKYWNRWKAKDENFLAILKRQSRGNMLIKYNELNKLLKDYRRDIKSNLGRLTELKNINDQYQQSVRNGKYIALRVMSTFLQKSLNKAIELWRSKARLFKKAEQNYKFENLGKNIEELMSKKQQMLKRVIQLQSQNNSLKQNCLQGGQYANLLKQLLYQKEKLSISLADKKHNMKILLEDNLKIKQKLKSAQEEAMKLISEFEPILNNQDDQ